MILINRCVRVYIYQHISPIWLKKKTCLMSFHFLFFSPQHNPPVCIHNCYSFPLTEELQSAIIHREAHNDFLATQTAVLSHTRAQTHKNRSCCFIAVSLQQLLSWGRSTED